MATSKPLQEESLPTSISSAEDSPVKIFHRPVNEPVSRELARAFGLNSPASLGLFDPDTWLLKTSQACLIDGQCQELSENWPDSGMWDAGAAFELQSSGQAILENESSLWPTAVAKDDGKTPEAHLAMKQRMGERDGTGANRTAITSLAVKVQKWPTPHGEDGESCGNHPNSQGDSLTGATKLWTTPQAHDSTPGNPDRVNRFGTEHGGRNLTTDDVTLWQTPHGMSNTDFRGKVGGCGGGEFAKQANQWQTPATDSFRSRGGDRKDEMGLDQQARSHQAPATQGGPA